MPSIPILEYIAVIILGFGIWLGGRFWPSKIAPFGALISRIMHHRNTRLALVVVWWWLGWHFFTE